MKKRRESSLFPYIISAIRGNNDQLQVFLWYLQLTCLRQIKAVIAATYCMFSHSLILFFSLHHRVLFLIYPKVAFERLGYALMTKLAGAFRK